MNEATVQNSGRTPDGKFAAGNSGGPGNPFAGKVAKIRKIFFETISEEDMVELTKKLVEIAKEGHFPAIKFIMTYMLGKPEAIHAPEKEKEKKPESPKMSSGDISAIMSLLGPPSPNGVFENPAEMSLVNENRRNRPPNGHRKKRKR